MCDTFEIKQYSIISSLNERNIYIKLTDNVNFINYEGNVDAKELRIQFELADIYNLIKNCFEQKDNFNVSFNVSSGNIKLLFNAKVGGFLKVNFEALFKEKLMSNDGQLTLNINKIEQKHNSLFKRFEEFEKIILKQQKEHERILEIMGNMYINIGTTNDTGSSRNNSFYKINSKILDLNNGNNWLDYSKIEAFYCLEKLTMTTHLHSDFTQLRNTSLIELICNSSGQGNLQSLKGIENFPKLTRLTVTQAPNLNNIVAVLSNIKHKINELNFQSCSGINVIELQNYCQKNNIKLAIC